MLSCIPLVYVLLLQGNDVRSDFDRTIRNPLIGGIIGFMLFLVLQFILGLPLTPDYQAKAAFWNFAFNDLLLPLSFSTFIYCLFFGKSLLWPASQLACACQSYMAIFLFLLSCQDLVFSVSYLTPVELFFRPMARVILYILLCRTLSNWRLGHGPVIRAVLLFGLCQILVAFGITLTWLNQIFWGGLFFILPLTVVILVLYFPHRWRPVAASALVA